MSKRVVARPIRSFVGRKNSSIPRQDFAASPVKLRSFVPSSIPREESVCALVRVCTPRRNEDFTLLEAFSVVSRSLPSASCRSNSSAFALKSSNCFCKMAYNNAIQVLASAQSK